jgi:hypothetical protein
MHLSKDPSGRSESNDGCMLGFASLSPTYYLLRYLVAQDLIVQKKGGSNVKKGKGKIVNFIRRNLFFSAG